MFDWKKPTVQMLGRWQPWHNGHTELFKKALTKTGQVCIMIRDVHGVGDNPYDFHDARLNIINALRAENYVYGDDYIILHMPNIVDVAYGRDVGYTFSQHDLGEQVHSISATKIRERMREEGTLYEGGNTK